MADEENKELCAYCKKRPRLGDTRVGSEDCFYGNIYYGTPEDPGIFRKPVKEKG